MKLDRNSLKGSKMLLNKQTGRELLPAPENIYALLDDSKRIREEEALEVTRKGLQ